MVYRLMFLDDDFLLDGIFERYSEFTFTIRYVSYFTTLHPTKEIFCDDGLEYTGTIPHTLYKFYLPVDDESDEIGGWHDFLWTRISWYFVDPNRFKFDGQLLKRRL